MAFRAMLVVALPFIGYFPAVSMRPVRRTLCGALPDSRRTLAAQALLLYWVSNNAISLVQSLTLKQNAVRKLFGIPIVPPKPQPGEPGYVAEPSFSDAFKNMQIGMKERWEETKEKAEAERLRKEKWEGILTRRAELYVPQTPAPAPSRQVGHVEQVANGLRGERGILEQVEAELPTRSNSTNEILAQPAVSSGTKEAERAKRVQAARQKRRRQ